MPWRNGGGITREYLTSPCDEGFDWRLSVAEVAHDGPFSEFPGVERILVLLGGRGMTLHFAEGGPVSLLRPLEHHRFAGEASVRAGLFDGPTTDLNLFWRRDHWDAGMQVLDAPCELPGDGTVLAYVVEGTVVADGVTLHHGDVLRSEGSVRVEGDARMVVFVLVPVTGACR